MDRVQSSRAQAIRHSSFWLLPFAGRDCVPQLLDGAVGSGPVIAPPAFFSVNNSDSSASVAGEAITLASFSLSN